MHATTILCVRKGDKVVMMGDGQVSQGSTVVKPNAKKVRRIGEDIVAGFAGSTADCFTLMERLERKLEEHPGQLTRACVDLAKAWRTDKYLRRLEASLLVADKSVSFEITGLGDVLEPKDGVIAIGSGGTFALGTYSSDQVVVVVDLVVSLQHSFNCTPIHSCTHLSRLYTFSLHSRGQGLAGPGRHGRGGNRSQGHEHCGRDLCVHKQ